MVSKLVLLAVVAAFFFVQISDANVLFRFSVGFRLGSNNDTDNADLNEFSFKITDPIEAKLLTLEDNESTTEKVEISLKITDPTEAKLLTVEDNESTTEKVIEDKSSNDINDLLEKHLNMARMTVAKLDKKLSKFENGNKENSDSVVLKQARDLTQKYLQDFDKYMEGRNVNQGTATTEDKLKPKFALLHNFVELGNKLKSEYSVVDSNNYLQQLILALFIDQVELDSLQSKIQDQILVYESVAPKLFN